MLVLTIAIVLESFSLRTAIHESNPIRGKATWVEFIRHSKAPELPVVLLEDLAALLGLSFAFVGVGLTALTGLSVFDAVSTLFIGALLVVVAVILGIQVKGLLIGEGASDQDVAKIESALLEGSDIDRIIHMKTLYLGPDEFMIGAKVSVSPKLTVRELAVIVNRAEKRIRAAVPAAAVIYIEPDVYVDPQDPKPPTEAFILKSSD